MDQVAYNIVRHPLNPRKTLRGLAPMVRGLLTIGDLFTELHQQGLVKGEAEWFVASSEEWGSVEDWGMPLLPDDTVTFCPNVQGPIPLPILIAGLVLGAVSVGYSIYAYMDMKSTLNDLISQDPTREDHKGSQAYTFTGMNNHRTDGNPIPQLYGTTKVGGTIINECFYGPVAGENERYKVALGLCNGGPIAGITGPEDILLDDVRLTEYTKYSYEVKTGTQAQTAHELFPELYQQHYPDAPFINPTVIYFPFNGAAGSGEEPAQYVRNPNDETEAGPPFNYGANYTMDSGTKKFGTHSVNLTAANARLRWGADTLKGAHWRYFDPRSDPFSIKFWMYFTTTDWNNMGTWPRKYTIWYTGAVNDAIGNAWWHLGMERLGNNTFRFFFQARWADDDGATPPNPLWQDSLIVYSTSLVGLNEDNAWKYLEFCRDGEWARLFYQGQDITDEGATVFGDKPDVYTHTIGGGSKFLFLGCNGGATNGNNTLYGFRGRVDDAVFQQNGPIPIGDYSVPTAAHDIDSEGLVSIPSRGYADKLMWQYRLPKGLIWAHHDKTRKESMFSQERVEMSARTVYTHCPNSTYDTAGYGPWVRDAQGHNQSLLLRHFECALDYVRLGTLTGNIKIGEKLTTTGGGVGTICGFYRAASNNNYVYLNNATGTFSGTASAPSLTSASVLAGLATDTTYDHWKALRASASWQNNSHASMAELKSFTEVRRISMDYPWLAYLVLEIEAQKGLTRKPKINVVLRGQLTKTLYYWNGTAVASYTGTMTNPAHVCWDMMTDGFYDGTSRYGLGYGLAIHPRYMDYDAWAKITDVGSWAYYCNQSVAIPGGGTQPRCKINIVFDEKDRTAWDCLQDAALVGRGKILPIGNTWTVKVDRPADPVMTVNPAMIKPRTYSEEYIEDTTKFDELVLECLDEEHHYMKHSEGYAVEEWDDLSVNRAFRSETKFVKGITNRHQLRRDAIRRVQKNAETHKRATWKMGVEAFDFEVNDILKVLHASNKYGHGGLVEERAGETIFLGKTIFLSSAIYATSDPILSYRSNSANDWDDCVVIGPWDIETNYVLVADGKTLAAGDPWALGRDVTQDEESDFDLIRIEEMGIDEKQNVEIVGFNYAEESYYHQDYNSGNDVI